MKERYTAQATPTEPPAQTAHPTLGLDAGWAPLFQALLWILFWGYLIRFIHRNFNRQLGGLLTALVSRVQQGSPLEAGTFFKLGAPPAITSQQVSSATSEGTQGVAISENQNEMMLHYHDHVEGLAERVYLIHAAEVITPRQANQAGQYRVRVWLEAYSAEDFNACTRVTYRLHDTFIPQIIATEAKNNQFELWLNVWGEFTVIACVNRQDQPLLWLTRYLDLPGRPPD